MRTNPYCDCDDDRCQFKIHGPAVNAQCHVMRHWPRGSKRRKVLSLCEGILSNFIDASLCSNGR